jgi:hypothetical protein
MPDQIFTPEFRDELEFTNYPFADGASLTADSGEAISNDTFLDGCVYPIGATTRVYIKRIEIATGQATFVLSDILRKDLASAVVNLLTPSRVVQFFDNFGRPAGILLSEPIRLSRFSAWSIGTHSFQVGATEFVATAVIPTPETGVRGIRLPDGRVLTGPIWLLGDNGITVREDAGRIRVDVIGDPLFVRERCGPIDRFEVPNFIKTINNCPPDQHGNFNLTVGDHFNDRTIVRIYHEDDGLVIEAVGQTNAQAPGS